MKSTIRKESEKIFSKKEYQLSELVSILSNSNVIIEKPDLDYIQNNLINSYLLNIELYDEQAKEHRILECIEEFETEIDILIKGSKRVKYLKIIKANVIAGFESKIDQLDGRAKPKTDSRKMSIKQDISVLIALFLELEKKGVLIFSKDRLGKLFEENFLNSNQESISKATVKTMCSKGISPMQYKDLKGILKQIVNDI